MNTTQVGVSAMDHSNLYTTLRALNCITLEANTQDVRENKVPALPKLKLMSSVLPDFYAAEKGKLLLGLFLILLPILTYQVTTWRFRKIVFDGFDQNSPSRSPPVAPYWDILFGHFFDLAWDTKSCLSKMVELARHNPVEVKAGFINFTVISNPDQIQKVFRSCSHLSNKRMAVVALQSLLGASKEVAHLFNGATPVRSTDDQPENSTLKAEKQLKDHVHGFSRYARDYLSGSHLTSLSQRYLGNLASNFDALAIENDWIHFPDLYSFLQSIVSPSTIEALMGSKIFEINPNIAQDFWIFERGTPQFLRHIPRLLMPRRYAARDRVFDTMKKLDELAVQHGVSMNQGDDPEWEPYLGSKFLRARHDYGNSLKSLPANTKAWEKMGILFGANANLLPSMFWYIFEALKDESLRTQMMAEVQSCVSQADPEAGSNLDLEKLLEQPLLQSAYAETLRLRVAIALPQTCERSTLDVLGHSIEKDKHIMMLTWPVLQDDDAWARAGKPPLRSFDEFWAERFLVRKQDDPSQPGIRPGQNFPEYEFSVRGLAGRWMPYGGGQHLCPGRHYAKAQLIGTFAFLFLNYELELLDTSKVAPDMRWFPSGSLPPNKRVPFRIRRKGKEGK